MVFRSWMSEQRFAERWGHIENIQLGHGYRNWYIHQDPVHADADTKALLFGRAKIGDAN